MKKIVPKCLVAFVFALLSVLPYVGPFFAVLTVIWILWALVLIFDLVKVLVAEGFTESEFQNRPDRYS